MKKLLDFRHYILEIVISLVLLMMVGITFIQVISRYVFRISLPWSGELDRYLLLWFGMLTAGYCFKLKAHIVLTFVFKKLPFVFRKIINIFIFAVLDLIFLVMIVYGIKYTYMGIHCYSHAMNLPLAFVYAAIPVGGGIMLYYNITNFYTIFIKNRNYGDTFNNKWLE